MKDSIRSQYRIYELFPENIRLLFAIYYNISIEF